MISGIDHVLIAVEDMDKAMGLYRRFGFQVLVGGSIPPSGLTMLWLYSPMAVTWN